MFIGSHERGLKKEKKEKEKSLTSILIFFSFLLKRSKDSDEEA